MHAHKNPLKNPLKTLLKPEIEGDHASLHPFKLQTLRQEDEEDLDGVGWGRHKGRSEGPSEPERHIHYRGQGIHLQTKNLKALIFTNFHLRQKFRTHQQPQRRPNQQSRGWREPDGGSRSHSPRCRSRRRSPPKRWRTGSQTGSATESRRRGP